MGQLLGKQSPEDVIEQAHSLKTDPVTLEVLRESILLSGRSVTLFPSRGILHPNRLVYSGDLSNHKGAHTQIKPLLILEYLIGSNAGLVKHGITGEVLMILVREPCEVGFEEGGKAFSCSCGGETEARLYANGYPVAVNVSEDFMDVWPAPQNIQPLNASGKVCLGSSMVELVKHSEDRGIQMLSQRSSDGFPTRRVAAFSQVSGQHVAVFKMLDCTSADPLAALVMAWWTSFDNT